MAGWRERIAARTKTRGGGNRCGQAGNSRVVQLLPLRGEGVIAQLR